jgi:putative ABC transport system permease protein
VNGRLWLLPSRGAAVMSATIAVLALLIAAFGAYGVMSHVLGRQKREFAIRHALGADTGRLVRFGVGQGMVLADHLLVSLRPQCGGSAAYVTATSVVLLTCVLACYLPVRHIAYGDPIEALRVE